MKKRFKLGSPILTVVLFIIAGILLFGSSIGGARAALTYFSETYRSQVEMYDIGVTLNENGKGVSRRDYDAYSDGQWNEKANGILLENRWSDKDPLQLGKAYDEVISVTNSGTIDHYMRVSLYKYWVKDGKKLQELDPTLIDLHLVNQGSYWILDANSSTPERTVCYYNRILGAGETSAALTDTLTVNVDGTIATTVTQKVSGNRIITTYDYDGLEFRIEAVVDAVQTHNAEDAIWSAWGRKVHINNGILSLD